MVYTYYMRSVRLYIKLWTEFFPEDLFGMENKGLKFFNTLFYIILKL